MKTKQYNHTSGSKKQELLAIAIMGINPYQYSCVAQKNIKILPYLCYSFFLFLILGNSQYNLI
ncbi:MAG: hypothetical protein IPI59_04800 [Sphingobacteriales bacterium]|nr:hypothetical protein [Sphingobacteriales bacterium]MBP9140436.1 hypothetical protein [Chitinophagales bacterium]MDA0197464.1 hypothetical protein [Bacteroidota bacterium]MBK6891303.1 hypothetical protein [Sphingobacteriales bacterium]MBK7526868.1 hypothetical protein [Sphingobacteriales bacterium]